jgi:hypothetical protein
MKIQNNQKAITTATSKVGGISNLYSYWMYSSSECSDRRVWLVSLSDSTYSDSKDINKGDTSSIFPVLEF